MKKDNKFLYDLINLLSEENVSTLNESSDVIISIEDVLKNISLHKEDVAILSDSLAKVFNIIKNKNINKNINSKTKFLDTCNTQQNKNLSGISDLTLGEFLRLCENDDIVVDKMNNKMWKITKEDHGTKGKEDIVTIGTPYEDKLKYPEFQKANFEMWDTALEDSVTYKNLVRINKE